MQKLIQFERLRVIVFLTAALTLVFCTGNLSAQWCSATSFSTSTSQGGVINAVEVKDASGNVLAAYSGMGFNNSVQLLNSGSPVSVSSGESLTVTITTNNSLSLYGYATAVGVWLDADSSGGFTSSECIADPQSGPFSSMSGSASISAKLTVPCSKKTLRTRLRFRANLNLFSSYFTKNSGCGNPGLYGNQFDLSIQLKSAYPPGASIITPSGPNYNKAKINFRVKSPSPLVEYTWWFQNAGMGVASPGWATGPSAKTAFIAPGTYDVWLFASYCGYKDSAVDTVKVVSPAAVPVADFVASVNNLELYEHTKLFDLSTYGPYQWNWEVISPAGNTYTAQTEIPDFTINETGYWKVCLTSENGNGPSKKVCKDSYLYCAVPSHFAMKQDTIATSAVGDLVDDGGLYQNYQKNASPGSEHFLILPCGATEISLSFKTLKLADTADKLRIFKGSDAKGLLVATISGGNAASYRNQTLTIQNSSVYISFESNGSGTDSGFLIAWKSVLKTVVAPESHWTTMFNPAGVYCAATFVADSRNVWGPVDYEWMVDGNGNMGTNQEFTYTFTDTGIYQVSLITATCNGVDTFNGIFKTVTPVKPGILEFTANKQRPGKAEPVKFSTTTDYASNFEWSVYPTSYLLFNGTSINSQNPEIGFTACGSYDITVTAWNAARGKSATQKTVTKYHYVIVPCGCTPTVNTLISDVGINEVRLSKGSSVLLDQKSSSGVSEYTDYSKSVSASVTSGVQYKLEISRSATTNPANFKGWIDWNLDGDFDDTGEEVLSSSAGKTNMVSATFVVPDYRTVFYGKTKLRVAAAYNNQANTPCGPNGVGEYEDYSIVVFNNDMPPWIEMTGSDTIVFERNDTSAVCYQENSYAGKDSTEGDLTSKVIVSSNLDCTKTGFYEIELNLTDACGNRAVSRHRTVKIVVDLTPPVITLNGNSPMLVQQCDLFTDPGARAIDKQDGDISATIVKTGNVDASVIGDYEILYSVKDAHGNKSSVKRTVLVRDKINPGIYLGASRITDGQIVKVPLASVFTDVVYAKDSCNGTIAITKTAGVNGPVNTNVKRTYPVTYYAKDNSGNEADEYGFTVYYMVGDFVGPQIVLNTADTILHDVNTPYTSQQVTVTDDVSAPDKITLVKSGTVNSSVLGVYAEKYTATDENGNSAVKVRTVKVVDRIAPVVAAPPISICMGYPFWALTGVTVTDNYDKFPSANIKIQVTGSNVNVWEAGIYYINYKASDSCGNQSAVFSRTVVVQDPPCFTDHTVAQNLENQVSVYPNPSRGIITIAVPPAAGRVIVIDIYNTVGQCVYQSEESNLAGNKPTIDLGKFGTGVYVVRIKCGQSVVSRYVSISSQ